MSDQSKPIEVLIVGGGVAALEAALALRGQAGPLVRTTMLAPNSEFVCRPAAIGEPFDRAAASAYPLPMLASDLGLRLHSGSLEWIDTAKQTVHTDTNDELHYDALLLTPGARRYAPLEHALTLDPARLDFQLHGLVQDVEDGYVSSLALVIPARNCWPLPMYELALMTATRAWQMDVDTEITLITPEEAPLAIFGDAASEAVQSLLDARRVTLITGSRCVIAAPGRITLHPADREIEVQRVVALPELHGPAAPGIPRSAPDGFLSTDRNGAIHGVRRIFAAGDCTDFPLKHGAIAAQQADAAAASIARLAGAEVPLCPLDPTLYGVLWGGEGPLYLRARYGGTRGLDSEVSTKPLWSPPGKIHGRYLGPYLDSLGRAGSAAAA